MKTFHHFNVIVVQKWKIFNFDTALIQNQLNDSGDFEVHFGTDFFNSTAAFLAETIANRLKFPSKGRNSIGFYFMTARMPCRSSSSNAANILTMVNIQIQFLLVYGNCNRMSLFSGNVLNKDCMRARRLKLKVGGDTPVYCLQAACWRYSGSQYM